MIPMYTKEEFNNAKSKNLLPLKCKGCGKVFYRKKSRIRVFMSKNTHDTGDHCSNACIGVSKRKHKKVVCKQCGKNFNKKLSEIKKSPNHFCNHSCAATYGNTHKTTGTRRSKLEVWLEEQLTKLYPDLEIHFNRKDAINSELDIYIPSLKLAFELNGIFHYEPIYGKDKLEKIQSNDHRKSQACYELGIEFCIIDTSAIKHFKEQRCKKYLDIITNIISFKLER